MHPSANIMLPPPPPAPNGSAPAGETRTATCQECSGAFSYDLPADPTVRGLVIRCTPKICAKCALEVEAREIREQAAREAADRRKVRAERWESVCPPLYADTDPARLPAAALKAVEGWRYGPKGLALCGPSGRCKTRAMLLLGKRLVTGEGRNFVYLPASDFAHRVSRLASEKVADLDSYLERLCRAEVLFLDDVGKGRLTDRVEAELYHVIEQRTAHRRPVMFTANASAAGLRDLLSEDRGEPIVRRLKDFCEVVVL